MKRVAYIRKNKSGDWVVTVVDGETGAQLGQYQGQERPEVYDDADGLGIVIRKPMFVWFFVDWIVASEEIKEELKIQWLPLWAEQVRQWA